MSIFIFNIFHSFKKQKQDQKQFAFHKTIEAKKSQGPKRWKEEREKGRRKRREKEREK